MERNTASSTSVSTDAQPVLDFFTCLLKAVRFLRLYPSAHPLIARAFDELEARWQTANTGRHRIGFESRNGSVYADRTELFHAPRSIEPLKKILEEKQIDAIWVTPATPFSELRDLVELLAQTNDDLFRRDDFDPNRLVGLRNVHIARGSSMPVGGAPEPPGAAGTVSIPRALLNALAASLTPEALQARLGADSVTRVAQSLVDGAVEPASIPRDAQPNLLTYAMLAAVHRLVPERTDPGTEAGSEALGHAFAHVLEQLVDQRLDGKGYDRARALVLELLDPFDAQFVHRLIPPNDDGDPDPDHMLRRFSPSLKVDILEGELEARVERALIERLARTLARDDDELSELLGSIELPPEPAPAPPPEPDETSDRRRATILVVDPTPDDGIALRRALAEEHADVHLLLDPGRFATAMDQLHPDVVVIEPKMRDVSGLELIAELRRTGGDYPVPLVVYTSEESFRHDFEIGTYPNARYALKSEGPARVVEHVHQLMSEHEPAPRPANACGDLLRPASDLENRALTVPGFDVWTMHAPGDGAQTVFYEVHRIDEHRTAIVFAGGFRGTDGPGNAKTRARLRKALAEDEAPSDLLSAINDVLHTAYDAPPLVAAIALMLDGSTGRIDCALAGAPRPIRRHNAVDTTTVDVASGIMLGFSQRQIFDASLEPRTIELPDGDTLLVHSRSFVESAGAGDEKRGAAELRREVALLGDQPADLIARLGRLADDASKTRPADHAAIAIRRRRDPTDGPVGPPA